MKHRYKIVIGWKHFWRNIRSLIKNPIFIILTIIGNCLVFSMSSLFYYVEKGTNAGLTSYLDAIWWATATVTTVGYGAITPTTLAGKIIDMILMIAGTAIFLSYTALFAGALLGPAMKDMEEEIRLVDKKISQLNKNSELK